MPIMVIRSTSKVPEFLNPCDTFKLCPAHGNFSVDADREKVNSTLRVMIETKSKSYEALDDKVLARFTRVFSPVFVPREGLPAAADAPDGAHAPANESAIDRMKREFAYGTEEEEAAWVSHTGWNLLTLACATDNETAVDELLALPHAAALLDAKGADLMVFPPDVAKGKVDAKIKHRADPLSQLFLAYAKDMTPLLAASTFASTPILTKLLDLAGDARARKEGSLMLGEVPCHFRGSILSGRTDNTRAILQRFPDLVNKPVGPLKPTPLHMACWSGTNQAEHIRLLLEHGGKVGAKHGFYDEVLLTLASFYDSDPESVRMVVAAGGNAARQGRLHGMAKYMFKPLSGMLGKDKGEKTNYLMYGTNKWIKDAPASTRATPAHIAAKRGDVAFMEALIKASGPKQLDQKDRLGRTALQVLEEATAPSHDVSLGKDTALSVIKDTCAAMPAQADAAKRKGRPDQVLPPSTK
jgi:hypothetical protein